MKILVEKDGKIKKIPIRKLIKDYRPVIEKICFGWYHSFYFDKSITSDDLVQELNIKLHSSLSSYNYKKSSIITFTKKVAKNYFLNKRASLLTEDRYPNDGYDIKTNGNKPVAIYSIYDKFTVKDSETSLVDIISSPDSSPELAIMYHELIEAVRKRLSKEKYTPFNFIQRKKTFTLKVFDLLLSNSKKWQRMVLMDFKCRVRYAKNWNSRKPNKVSPTASSVSTYLGVDIRTVIRAFKIIRKTIETVARVEQ